MRRDGGVTWLDALGALLILATLVVLIAPALLKPRRRQFCGIPVQSPLGIPAGPLLNSRWLLYYASLGFDVLTYKTVRSSARAGRGVEV